MNTLKFGNGEWYGKKDTILAYNDENSNYKPLPFDFSRASSATVVNKDGLIETVGSGEPRIDYKDDSKGALLLEPSRTNVWTNSNLSASISLDGLTKVLSQGVSPSGDADATLFNETATTGTHRFYRLDIPSTSTDFSMSFFAKKNGINIIRIVSQGGTKFADFDLSLGIVNTESGVNSSVMQYYGNGWYRCIINVTASGWVGLYALNDSSQNSYLGDVSKGVYLYGAQLELGSYATSYIPTQGSAVTRLADSCSQTAPDGVIGQTEGTIFLDFKPQTLDATSRFLSIENSSSVSNGWMGIFSALVSGDIRFRFYGDGWDFNSALIIEKDTRYKIAVSYKNGVQTSAYVNGNLIGNLTASLSGKSFEKIRLSEAQFGVRGDADFNDIKLYNTRLSNSELAALTQV